MRIVVVWCDYVVSKRKDAYFFYGSVGRTGSNALGYFIFMCSGLLK